MCVNKNVLQKPVFDPAQLPSVNHNKWEREINGNKWDMAVNEEVLWCQGGWDVLPAFPKDMAVRESGAREGWNTSVTAPAPQGSCSCEPQPPPHSSQSLPREDLLRIIQLEFPWLSGSTAPVSGDSSHCLHSARACGVCDALGRLT